MSGRQRSNASTEVLAKLAAQDRGFFTIPELEQLLGVDHARALAIASRLHRAGLVRRLRKGLYAVLEPSAWGAEPGQSYVANRYGAAAALAGPDPYYLAFYTAMELHGLITHPLVTVFVAMTVQRPSVVVPPVRFRFVKLTSRRFFGFEAHSVNRQAAVERSTLERTYMDCVDRFELCGGAEEVAAAFKRGADSLDEERLLRYVERLSEASLTKRLGFMLETTGVGSNRLLRHLEAVAGRLGRYIPLVPRAVIPDGSTRDRRWELIVNVPRETLRTAGDT